MNFRQRTISITLASLVLLGGMIEIMKSTQRSSSTHAIRTSGLFGMNLDGMNLDGDASSELSNRPSREAAERARARLSGRLQGVLGGGLGGQTTSKATEEKPAVSPADGPSENPLDPNSAATANLGDPKKINTADAAKTKAANDKKKKKKKKKKSDTAKSPQVEVSVTEGPEKKDKPYESPQYPSSVVYRSANQSPIEAARAEEEKEDDFNSLEEWIAYILPQPSYERTMKMLQELQSKRLEPAIFYDVVTEMLGDSRPKMQELGLVAIGSYPSLRSYLILYAANIKFPAASNLKVQSRNYLNNYSRVENLRYLSSVLTARVETDVVFEALKLIIASANFYSGQATPSSGTGSANPPQPAATPAGVVRQFSSLVPILNRLAQTASDAAVRQEASTTLRQVQVITGS